MARAGKYAARAALAVAAFVLVATALSALALMTTTGQTLALRLGAFVASDAESSITIGALEGSLLSDGRIAAVTVADRNGEWLAVRDIRFSWSPLRLISGQIEIAYLTVGRIDVIRTPVGDAGAQQKSGNGGASFIALVARRFEIGVLALHEPVLGTPANFTVRARADLAQPDRALTAALDVTRLDGPGGQLHFDGAYRAGDRVLEVNLSAAEPAKGVLAGLLQMPDAPALSFAFNGAGPIDRWRGAWSMAAAEQTFVAGSATVDRDGERHRVNINSEGYLGPLVPAVLSDVLAGKTTLTVAGVLSGLEIIHLEQLSVASDALRITAAGGADLTQRYVHGEAVARVATADGAAVQLPLASGEMVSLGSLDMRVSLPDRRTQRQVAARIDVRDVSADFGSVGAVQLSAVAQQASPLGDAMLDVQDAKISAVADGVQPHDAALAAVLGPKIEMSAVGQREGEAFEVSDVRVATQAGLLSGRAAGVSGGLSATAELNVPDLGALTALTGEGLGGRATVRVRAERKKAAGPLQISLEGLGEELRADTPALNGLIAGTTRLAGNAEIDAAGGYALRNLVLSSGNLDVRANGKRAADPSAGSMQLELRGKIADLARLNAALSGAASLEARLDGKDGALTSYLRVAGEDFRINGRAVRSPVLTFNGAGTLPAHGGTFELTGDMDGAAISGAGRIGIDAAGAAFAESLRLAVASARVTGDIRLPKGERVAGRLDIDAPKLSVLAPLAGRPLDGAVTARIDFAAEGVPAITVRAKAPSIGIGTTRIGDVAADIDVVDYIDALRFKGKARVARIDAGSSKVRNLRIEANDAGTATAFRIGAEIDEGQLSAGGKVEQQGAAIAVTLAEMKAALGGVTTSLDAPANIVVAGGNVEIKRLLLKSGNGRLQVSGKAGADAMALSVSLQRLPAAIANAFAPELGLEGQLDGNIDVRGTAESPAAEAKVKWSGAAAAASRAQFIPPLAIDLQARLRDGVVNGAVQAGGVPALSVQAKGTFHIGDKSTKARLDGTIPLSLANASLAERNTRVSGTLRLGADVSGTAEAPHVDGMLNIEGAEVSDPASGLKLQGIGGSGRFSRTSLVIERITGTGAKGGSVAIGGRVIQAADGPVSVSLRVDLDGLKFDDRELLAGEVDGNVSVEGTLAALQANGDIRIKRLDVIVPNRMPHSVAALDLKHVNAPADSYAGRASAKAAPERAAAPVAIGINIGVEAASRIFVRGRGLDAQLGGALRVGGTASRPVANGGFSIERGRLDMLGRQLSFKRGQLIFAGDIEPSLDMEAVAEADGVTISVFVTGPASEPKFRFSSSPALPEDEVVARLLFNKSLAKLSPMQLAQLASEVDKIGGLSSGPSTFDQVKGALGVDVLDVTTNDKNSPEVSAGKYVNESTYVGVRQGSSATSSRVIIDHDLSKNLKARGELGADGNSKIGVGVEWDY